MLFPELQQKSSIEVNLDEEAQKWLHEQPKDLVNPLLDPATCLTFIYDLHRRLGVEFSYGGWLENRSALWKGSYLDQDDRYIHLGVDFNVPAGTRVTIDRASTVVRIDNDYPDVYGWGTRVILRDLEADVMMIFAHLEQELHLVAGQTLPAGSDLARVGSPPYNGNWFPHLHVQMVTSAHYQELLKNDLRDLDGYGHEKNLEKLKRQFPNPLNYVSVK